MGSYIYAVRDFGSEGDMGLFVTLFVACFIEVMLIKAITEIASASIASSATQVHHTSLYIYDDKNNFIQSGL
ncbi:Hypothetical predicted protein [Cloeon dipterum]|uniref:Uncharacterized protein n=1 Tax=Cloeon dipterum TaxID=197152 RepID=A0A8S1DNV4_9INSE|nr:Hypothetical predicted protein [Cloeon dipterum]